MKKLVRNLAALGAISLVVLFFGPAVGAESQTAVSKALEELQLELESISAQLEESTRSERRLARRQEGLQDRISAIADLMDDSEHETEWRSRDNWDAFEDDWEDFADDWGEFWGEFGECQGEFWGEFGERLGETIVEIVETLIDAFD